MIGWNYMEVRIAKVLPDENNKYENYERKRK